MKQLLFTLGAIWLTQFTFAQDKILKDKGEITIKKMEVLNSPAKEANLCISANGQRMYFLSTRGGMPWSRRRSASRGGYYDGDIWMSRKKDGLWQYPENCGDEVNTSNNEDEPMIAQAGRSIFFQSWGRSWEYTNGPYYKAALRSSKFSGPVGLGGGIHQFFMKASKKSYGGFATDGASISKDGNTFLVCAGPDYMGNMDIYISRKVKGQWSKMKKLAVSTPGNERSVFIAHDSKTIYFASDGYEGRGGLDIYRTVLDEKGKPGEVINIGVPFNTPSDDRGFIISNSGDEAYFVRDDDIYFADTKKAGDSLKPSHMEKVSDELVVANEHIKIIFWDNSTEDGDIVSLKIDGEYIFKDVRLTKKRQEVELDLKADDLNDIVFVAENVGNSPPNTAAFIIDDGVTRQRLRLKSDLQVSSVMRIRVEHSYKN